MSEYVNTFNDIETVEQGRGVKKVFTAFVIVMCCLILAVAQPLSVAASESEDSGILDKTSVAVVSLLASGAASYIASVEIGLGGAAVAAMGGAALGPFVCGCIVVVLVGLGTALLVSGIAAAINKAYELGYFQEFVDKIAEGLNGGWISGIKNKVVFGAAMLSYAYTWVKEHIVDYFNEQVEVETPAGTLKGFNNSIATIELGSYTYVGNEFISGSGERILYTTPEYVYTNSVTNCNFKITVDVIIYCSTYLSWNSLKYHIYDEKNDITYDIITGTIDNINRGYKITPYLPIISDNKLLLPILMVNGSGNTVLNTNIGISNFNILHNNNTWQISGWNGSAPLCYFNGSQNCFAIEIGENKITTFDSYNLILYYLLSNNCYAYQCTTPLYGSTFINGTDLTISYNGTVIKNDYYNSTNDILKSAADTIRGKVSNGDITNQSEGTISIGVSDVYSGALTDGIVDSLAITNLATITELNATDIVSNNEIVLQGDVITSLPIALQIAAGNIRAGTVDLKYKFPFDVIYSVSTWLQALVVEGEPLVIDYDFSVPLMQEPIHVHIDFSRYQTLVTVGNWVVLVSVAIGCLLASKKAIEAI